MITPRTIRHQLTGETIAVIAAIGLLGALDDDQFFLRHIVHGVIDAADAEA